MGFLSFYNACFYQSFQLLILRFVVFYDVNQSGWLALLLLVPVIGPLALLNWTVKAGDPEENRFGKPQYTEPVDET